VELINVSYNEISISYVIIITKMLNMHIVQRQQKNEGYNEGYKNGPQNPTQRLQNGEGWAMGRHQFLITFLLVCEKWMRTSTRPSLGGCARLSLTWDLGCPVGVG